MLTELPQYLEAVGWCLAAVAASAMRMVSDPVVHEVPHTPESNACVPTLAKPVNSAVKSRRAPGVPLHIVEIGVSGLDVMSACGRLVQHRLNTAVKMIVDRPRSSLGNTLHNTCLAGNRDIH